MPVSRKRARVLFSQPLLIANLWGSSSIGRARALQARGSRDRNPPLPPEKINK